MTTVDVTDLVGGPVDRGKAHGRQKHAEIRACVDIYRLVLGRPDAALLQMALAISPVVRAFSPAVATEIDGIAEGADVDPRWIYLLNARSELMAGAVDGCTAVFDPVHGLLGQTWDWLDVLEPLTFIARSHQLDGTRLATLTEPGIVAKIGCNDAGIGVCLNFLYAPGPHLGVPVHVLLRSLLGCRSVGQIHRTLTRAGLGRAANVLVGTDSGIGLNIEYAGDHATVREIGGVAFVHTNHIDGRPESAGGLYENSRARASTAEARRSTITDVGSLVAVLDDRTDPDHPICAPYQPYQGALVGTTATVAMDLGRRTLHTRLGPNPGAPLHSLDV